MRTKALNPFEQKEAHPLKHKTLLPKRDKKMKKREVSFGSHVED